VKVRFVRKPEKFGEVLSLMAAVTPPVAWMKPELTLAGLPHSLKEL
jgi:hypothetical protein